jgi:hypothetical protein
MSQSDSTPTDAGLAGLTMIDTALANRRGPIVTARVMPDGRLDVAVMWTEGYVTTLRPRDIEAGRYQVVTA